VAKVLVFSDFSFDFAFRKCFSFFAFKSAPCDNLKSTTVVASKVYSVQQSKVDFGRISEVRSARHKVDFGRISKVRPL
jgi:hypothetical protein